MHLHRLSTRTAGAAENMALDLLLLQRYPGPPAVRFRHYEWRRPAVTFGYSQKSAWVRVTLEGNAPVELCRRPTGGGIVDHRNDWTYALVIPRGHEAEALPAAHSYRLVHTALAGALTAQGVAARLQPCNESATTEPVCADGRRPTGKSRDAAGPGVCFAQAEPFDVIDGRTGAKLAGAAQKRNKHGLLFQGSLVRSRVLAADFDWDRFEDDFVTALAAGLETEVQALPWPEFDEAELEALTEQYASEAWVDYR